MSDVSFILEFLSYGYPLLWCCGAHGQFILVDPSDNTTDLRHEQADGVADHSVSILRALVTNGSVHETDGQLEARFQGSTQDGSLLANTPTHSL